MRKLLSLAVVFFAVSRLFAQDLSIGTHDLRIEQRVDGGFHLFIRAKGNIASVLLTESTRDPNLRADNYAYRTAERNAINGDEIRIIDGIPIPRESTIYSLISSTPKDDPHFGKAFHIYIPYILYYGYETGRHGEVYVVDGTYLNIRAFALPYGDYRGAFKDNPFTLRVTQRPQPGPPEGNYMKDTVEAFTDIAETSGGETVYSTGTDDLLNKIRDALEKEKGKNLDMVICIDTTGSMRNDIDAIRKGLNALLKEQFAKVSSYRLGLVIFRDYNEEYLTKTFPFTSDLNVFQRSVNAIRTHGGKDIPEAVHEALYDGGTKFSWEAESRLMILIGDAPPHPRPRGKITKEMVDALMVEKNIRVHSIILPQ